MGLKQIFGLGPPLARITACKQCSQLRRSLIHPSSKKKKKRLLVQIFFSPHRLALTALLSFVHRFLMIMRPPVRVMSKPSAWCLLKQSVTDSDVCLSSECGCASLPLFIFPFAFSHFFFFPLPTIKLHSAYTQSSPGFRLFCCRILWGGSSKRFLLMTQFCILATTVTV